MKNATYATLLLAMAACAPGLNGGWDASGHTGLADPFALSLTFEDDRRGIALYKTEASGERAVPVCALKVRDQAVQFVTDITGAEQCSTLNRPLTFEGILGQDVIAGTVRNAAGDEVGIWRAYRRSAP